MRKALLPFAKITKLTFRERPISIPAELRPMWKITCMLLVLKLNCYGEKSSLSKLQLFNWGMFSESAMNRLITYSREKSDGALPDVVPLDPSLNRAIALALGDGLVVLDKAGKIKLSEKGNTLVHWILDDPDVLHHEKEVLAMIGKSIPESTLSKAYK
jgi:hypothetical protein